MTIFKEMLEKPKMRVGRPPDFKTVDLPSMSDRKKRVRFIGATYENALPWISLNPSGKVDDGRGATGKRIFEFAWRWAFDSVAVYNLYPFPTPDPKSLVHLIEGNEAAITKNLEFIGDDHRHVDALVVAWGSPPRNIRKHSVSLAERLVATINSTRESETPVALWCLGTTLKGFPRHPSPLGQVPTDTKPVRWMIS